MDSPPVPQLAASKNLHPRTVGWVGTTALAMGGINQSLFLIGALFIGQGTIPGQGSAAVPLLIAGLLLSWAATPGWVELILMYPNRVGGIAATCAEAFRPYSPILANLTGVCYWWGWVPTCGLTALLSASAIHHWYCPWLPVPLLASALVVFFAFVNLCGVKWVMRLAMPIAAASASLAFISALVPIFSGEVDWQQAFTFHLTVPFEGLFGQVTSVMAGLYLIGFAAPAFEQAACHVGETIHPEKNVPRAMFASAGLATLYFAVLPIIWLGTLGPEPLGRELALVLGPTFAPLLGAAAKSAAIWFMILNMFHGTIAPLAGAARTLSQLAEDGLLPEFMARRSKTDAPYVTTIITAVMAILFLLMGDPVWLIAAANLTYLIGIGMPNIAVWLLRSNHPEMQRPYRAPRGFIVLGLVAAGGWALATVLGFQQFGLPTVLAGAAFAYSGSALYAWRKFSDRRKMGLPGVARTLHVKLTGAMLLVLVLDAAGYLMAVSHVPTHHTALITVLEDIFVAVALLTISVGLILPGMIAHAAVEVSQTAKRLVSGTLTDFTRAMHSLAAGDLEKATAHFDLTPVVVHSRDEVGDMAQSFNELQVEIGHATAGLEGAREGLSVARAALTESNKLLSRELIERRQADQNLQKVRDEYALILNSISEGVQGVDVAGQIIFENPASNRMLGFEPLELIGKSVHAAVQHTRTNGSPYPVEESPLHLTARDGQARHVSSEVFWRKDGSSFPVDYTCTPIRNEAGQLIGAVVVFTDITERKELEGQFLRAQRMESIGTLAGGIAHDLNNVLAPIIMSVSMLRANCREEDIPLVEMLENSAHRGADMVRHVLYFARGIEGNHIATSPAALIREVVKMIADTFPKSITIQASLPDQIAEVNADPTQLHQVLLNFCVNARDAMPDGGCLTLTAENVQIDEEEARLHPHAQPGSYVAIAVRDTGQGIPEAIRDKIFEPFFTTKDIGKGTGLGLSTSLGIIKSHYGFLTVESEPGRGTSFRVFIPMAEAVIPPPPAPGGSHEYRGHNEMVLVVDDEPAIRMSARSTLEAAGYRVMTAENGADAATVFGRHKEDIAVVLTDIMMPAMDGFSLARVLHTLRPEVKIVATSGGITSLEESKSQATAIKRFLPKPYRAETLLRVMEETLHPEEEMAWRGIPEGQELASTGKR